MYELALQRQAAAAASRLEFHTVSHLFFFGKRKPAVQRNRRRRRHRTSRHGGSRLNSPLSARDLELCSEDESSSGSYSGSYSVSSEGASGEDVVDLVEDVTNGDLVAEWVRRASRRSRFFEISASPSKFY